MAKLSGVLTDSKEALGAVDYELARLSPERFMDLHGPGFADALDGLETFAKGSC